MVGLFDLWSGARTILISSTGAYLIAFYIEGPFMPWIGFVFLMGHMSVNHLHRQLVNEPSLIDITGTSAISSFLISYSRLTSGAQMVLIMKVRFKDGIFSIASEAVCSSRRFAGMFMMVNSLKKICLPRRRNEH